MVSGSLRLLPPLKLVAMKFLKVALSTSNQIKSVGKIIILNPDQF
jgi:hypothetical protein